MRNYEDAVATAHKAADQGDWATAIENVWKAIRLAPSVFYSADAACGSYLPDQRSSFYRGFAYIAVEWAKRGLFRNDFFTLMEFAENEAERHIQSSLAWGKRNCLPLNHAWGYIAVSLEGRKESYLSTIKDQSRREWEKRDAEYLIDYARNRQQYWIKREREILAKLLGN